MERFHPQVQRYHPDHISPASSSLFHMPRGLFVVLILLLLTCSGAAIAPSHPLSQITPIDTNLTMAGYSITGVSSLGGAMGTLRITDTVDIGANELRASTITTGGMTITGDRITGFLQDDCPAGTAVHQIHSNGTFTCMDALTDGTSYLNRTGGRLTGPLNMTGNPITDIGTSRVRFNTSGTLLMEDQPVRGLPTPTASSDAMPYGTAQTSFLSRDGSDKMTGTLDMDGNDVTNIDTLTANSINVPGNDNLTVQDSMRVNGTVWVRGADLAELYPARKDLDPGTIVTVGTGGHVRPAGPGDESIGVVSTDPGHVMGRGTGDVPVALEGRVPVRMDEQLSPGEPVVPGEDGVGTRCRPPDTLTAPMRTVYCQSQSIGVVLEQPDEDRAMVVLD